MASEELKQLEINRGNIKRALTRFEKHITTLDMNNLDVIELKERRNNFKPLLSQFNNIQDAIDAFEETNFEASEAEREKFEAQYYSLNSKVEKLLLRITQDSFPTSSSSNQAHSKSFSNIARLPKIELPKFTGNYEKWYDYYNDFYNLISQKPQSPVNAHLTDENLICSYCNKEHSIYNCVKFKDLTNEERLDAALSRNLCLNCLRKGHQLKTCTSSPCRKCNEKHNTLIHPEVTPEVTSTHIYSSSIDATQVLLSTAIVNIPDATGNYHRCRALLDSGSQSCFITNSFAKQLKLPMTPVNIPVLGINQTQTEISRNISNTIQSCYNAFKKNVDCLILDRITGNLPSQSIYFTQLNISKNIKLADPKFFTSSKIDLLFGAELFWELICVGQINKGKNQPIFQNTELVWIASGHTLANSSNLKVSTCSLCINSLTEFWNIEECTDKNILSLEEKYCEEYILNSYQRSTDGRFIVKIPLKENMVDSLGESRCQAKKRLHALERKFYSKFKGKKQIQSNHGSTINRKIDLATNSLLKIVQASSFAEDINNLILNSRSLIPLSNDPNDYATLTPGHFLIGDLLISYAKLDLCTTAINRLSHCKHFWSRRPKEYLSQLQIRNKRKTQINEGLQSGQFVIIRDDNLPPLQWHMGRIKEVHPAQDGVARAATLCFFRRSPETTLGEALPPFPTVKCK